MKQGKLTLPTEDGLILEARWDIADEPSSALVFCHPHPSHGGTMTAPLMDKVTGHLVESGICVLRFNFRGVGASEGSWGEGIGEKSDVSAAMVEASAAGLETLLGGWSFGAATALRWQAAESDSTTFCGVSPPVASLPNAEELRPAKRTIIMGERDQLIKFDDSKAYAASIGARFVPVPSDHFFFYREERVAGHMIEAFGS